MNWFKQKWASIVECAKEAITWFSIQLALLWGGIWLVYSQLPANVMVELATKTYYGLSIVAWAGIVQTFMIVTGRIKKQS